MDASVTFPTPFAAGMRGGQGAGLAVRLCLVAKPRVFGGQLAMLEGILGPARRVEQGMGGVWGAGDERAP